MFPIVMLVLNGSSVAVLYFGAHRIDKGEMQIGALIAFLTYLTQILLAVMMATFMAVLAPRAAVCAERISEVLDTPSSVGDPEQAVTELEGPWLARAAGRRVPLPGRRPADSVRHRPDRHGPGRRSPSSEARARARPPSST